LSESAIKGGKSCPSSSSITTIQQQARNCGSILAASPKLVKDINPGPGWSNPEYLTAVGNTLFFTAYDDTDGYQLWKTDGTAAGTVMLTSLAPSNSSPFGLLNVNGTLFFGAIDGTHGFELWKSDGTAAGTVVVKRGYYVPLAAVNGNAILGTAGNTVDPFVGLSKSDGTAAGTVGLAGGGISNLIVVGDTLYFSGHDLYIGYQLWKSDPSGTVRDSNINVDNNGAGLNSFFITSRR
jgi:ELWxxDGT repeat protein